MALGDQLTLTLPPVKDGPNKGVRLSFPGLNFGGETVETAIINVFNPATGVREPQTIPVRRANILTLRTDQHGAEYLAFTNEVTNFGRNMNVRPRFTDSQHPPVIGLDCDADGQIIGFQTLMDGAEASREAWLASRAGTLVTVTSAEDLGIDLGTAGE